MANFWYLLLELKLSVHAKPEQDFSPMGGLTGRFKELRHSKVKHKFFFFYNVSSPPSPQLRFPKLSGTGRKPTAMFCSGGSFGTAV